MAASIKTTVFCDLVPINHQVALMMKAVDSSETSISTRLHIATSQEIVIFHIEFFV
jgi:hypothetical protein